MSSEKAGSTNLQSFRLVEASYAHDSLQTCKDLWVKAWEGRQGECSDPGEFQRLLRLSGLRGSTRPLPAGTEVMLTGRATGMVSEVIIPGCPGTWNIPNEALKKAGLEPPPINDSYLQEQLP